MLKFSLLGVPITIEPWFWLVTALLGGGASAHGPDDWARVGVWIAVVLISILVHEFGHAFAGRHYGAGPFIRLHGFGGATFLPGAKFTRVQSIVVSGAGPAAGLLLGLLTVGIMSARLDLPWWAMIALKDSLWVNFGWTFLNLLPIHPLDGGQILAQTLGPRRVRITAAIGFVLAVVLGVWALLHGLIFSAMMLAMLAYYNFRQEPVEGGVVTPPT